VLFLLRGRLPRGRWPLFKRPFLKARQAVAGASKQWNKDVEWSPDRVLPFGGRLPWAREWAPRFSPAMGNARYTDAFVVRHWGMWAGGHDVFID
jgi:hypothetical protein